MLEFELGMVLPRQGRSSSFAVKRRRMICRKIAFGLVGVAALLVLPAAMVAAEAAPQSGSRAYLASIQSSTELQEFLDRTIDALARNDSGLRQTDLRVALLDLTPTAPPLLAHRHGDTPVYPASVVKFVYLMAAYALQEEGRLRIDAEMDELLT